MSMNASDFSFDIFAPGLLDELRSYVEQNQLQVTPAPTPVSPQPSSMPAPSPVPTPAPATVSQPVAAPVQEVTITAPLTKAERKEVFVEQRATELEAAGKPANIPALEKRFEELSKTSEGRAQITEVVQRAEPEIVRAAAPAKVQMAPAPAPVLAPAPAPVSQPVAAPTAPVAPTARPKREDYESGPEYAAALQAWQASTGETGGGTDGTPTEPVDTTPWKVQARTTYGWIVELYDAIPELKSTIDTAVSEKWTAERFQDAIKSTAWWKTTESSERKYIEEQTTDPATLQAKIERKKGEISAFVAKGGYTLGDAALTTLATQSVKFGWDTNQQVRYIGAEIVRTGTTGTSGTPAIQGADAATIRSLASQYGLQLSEDSLKNYTEGLISGSVTQEQIKQNFKMDAANLYPSLKAQLDAGRTVDQVVAPYKTTAANVLGISPDTIDFSDPNKWGRLLSYSDPKNNENRLMNLSEWGSYLRTLPEWQETDDAKMLYRDLASTIVRGFGKVRG